MKKWLDRIKHLIIIDQIKELKTTKISEFQRVLHSEIEVFQDLFSNRKVGESYEKFTNIVKILTPLKDIHDF